MDSAHNRSLINKGKDQCGGGGLVYGVLGFYAVCFM